MPRKLRGPHSEETRRKISEAQKGKPHLRQRGENHGSWKGEGVGYTGAHAYLRKYHIDKKVACEFCSSKERLEFAKKQGHEYTRRIEDYLILCSRCHLKYDGHLVKGLTPWNKGNVTTYPKTCPGCGLKFQGKKKRSIYCSIKCAAATKPVQVREKDPITGRWLALNPKKV